MLCGGVAQEMYLILFCKILPCKMYNVQCIVQVWWSCAGSVISVAGRPLTGGCILSLLIIITIIITRLSGQAFRPQLLGLFQYASLCPRHSNSLWDHPMQLWFGKFVSIFLVWQVLYFSQLIKFPYFAYLHVLHILCILHLFQHMYQCSIKYSNHQGSNRSSFSKVVSP